MTRPIHILSFVLGENTPSMDPVLVFATRDPICESGGDSSRDAPSEKASQRLFSLALPRTSLTNFPNPVSSCLALLRALNLHHLAARFKDFDLFSCTSWDPCLPAYSRACRRVPTITRYLLLSKRAERLDGKTLYVQDLALPII